MSASPDATSPPAPAPGLILVIEDDGVVRAMVADLLREMGYRVVDVGDAEQALQALDGGLSPDIVFSDLVTPGAVSPRQLVLELRTRAPAARLLFTSGYADADEILGELAPGVEFLRKPYRSRDLERRLVALAARR